MRGATFAAAFGSTPAACAWRAAAWSAALVWALALGVVFASAAEAVAADQPGLQREIRETRAIVDEVSKAVRRVQAENLRLSRTLGGEVGKLTAEDITATTLQLGRLEAETARLHVTTLEDRIARRQAALRLLGEDINRRAAELEGAPAATLESLGARAELEQLQEMHAVSADLLEGFRKLQDAELERLALAEERLALLRSRAELRTINENSGFDQDPRVVAIGAIVSRLARDAVRLDNEAGAARPKSGWIRRASVFCSSSPVMRSSAARCASPISR